MHTIKTYYRLAKPGIIYGNGITAIAGFFLASNGAVDWRLFVSMLIGLGLVMGSACVFNNHLDRDIDIKMERTKNRAAVTGAVSQKSTLAYGTILLIFGSFILWQYANLLALVIALIGIVFYVAFYTPSKRRTVYSTLIGSIAGATPPVVGYCAVAGIFNLEAFILFLIFAFWQMPHFYAIGIYRMDDYAAASIPILPIKKGIRAAKTDMLLYIVLFISAAVLLTVFGFAGYIYLTVVLLLGLIWLWLGMQGFQPKADDRIWARKMFFCSLIVVTVLSFAVALCGTWLAA